MTEFVSRMAAQRRVLRAVNRQAWHEQLNGLSIGAIQRWVLANRLSQDAEDVLLVRQINTLTHLSERILSLIINSQPNPLNPQMHTQSQQRVEPTPESPPAPADSKHQDSRI